MVAIALIAVVIATANVMGQTVTVAEFHRNRSSQRDAVHWLHLLSC